MAYLSANGLRESPRRACGGRSTESRQFRNQAAHERIRGHSRPSQNRSKEVRGCVRLYAQVAEHCGAKSQGNRNQGDLQGLNGQGFKWAGFQPAIRSPPSRLARYASRACRLALRLCGPLGRNGCVPVGHGDVRPVPVCHRDVTGMSRWATGPSETPLPVTSISQRSERRCPLRRGTWPPGRTYPHNPGAPGARQRSAMTGSEVRAAALAAFPPPGRARRRSPGARPKMADHTAGRPVCPFPLQLPDPRSPWHFTCCSPQRGDRRAVHLAV